MCSICTPLRMLFVTTNALLSVGLFYTTIETVTLIYTNNITSITYGEDVAVFITHTVFCQVLFVTTIWLMHLIRRLKLRHQWIRDNYQCFANA